MTKEHHDASIVVRKTPSGNVFEIKVALGRMVFYDKETFRTKEEAEKALAKLAKRSGLRVPGRDEPPVPSRIVPLNDTQAKRLALFRKLRGPNLGPLQGLVPSFFPTVELAETAIAETLFHPRLETEWTNEMKESLIAIMGSLREVLDFDQNNPDQTRQGPYVLGTVAGFDIVRGPSGFDVVAAGQL
jgi:hypothetical protein